MESEQGLWTFRIRTEGEEFVLQSHESDGWLDLYAFTREPQHPVDYETGNHWTSTHPHSPFVQSLVVQKGSLMSRLLLRNRELTELWPPERTTKQFDGDLALLELLTNRFGLALPAEPRAADSNVGQASA